MRLVKIPDQTPKKPAPHARTARLMLLIVPVALVANILRPLPNANIAIEPWRNTQTSTVELRWPERGQAAIAAQGFGLLETHGAQTPIATASIAKVITALCVLQKHPLRTGQKGPKIQLSEADYALYQNQLQSNGSLLPVYIGEQIDEYTALQALMLPSANNIADSLAVWAFGDLDAYHNFASAYVTSLGMHNTQIGPDASGYDPGTKSTASDLTLLGLAALKQPVLMEIAGQKSAYLPMGGRMYNYNSSLGTHGINGLKTGNNSENLGGLLFTQNIFVEGKKVTTVGVVIGEDSLSQAIEASRALAESMQMAFSSFNYKKIPVGTARTRWGTEAAVYIQQDGTLVHYTRSELQRKVILKPTRAMSAMEQVGTLTFSSGSVETSTPIIIPKAAAKPSFWWRMIRSPL